MRTGRALGERARSETTDAAGRATSELLPHFNTISYRELGERIEALAADLYGHPEAGLVAGDFVAILGFPGIDYTLVDLTCARLGAVVVPLPTTAPLTQLVPIATEVQPRVMAVASGNLELAVDVVLAGPTPERMVVFDYRAGLENERERYERAVARLADRGVRVETLETALERGRGYGEAPVLAGDADRLAALLYTSGSTELPKGAMYTERMTTGYWVSASTLPMISLMFLPLSHYGGRAALSTTLAGGGVAYFTASADMSTFFEDLALVRPTLFTLVPRLCDMVGQRFHGEVGRRLAEGADQSAAEAGAREFMQQSLFGNRCIAAACGSAPQSAELTALVESVLDTHLIVAYGATETGGVMVDWRVQRPPVTDYELIDVADFLSQVSAVS